MANAVTERRPLPEGPTPNPQTDPAAYLKGKGWRCLGPSDWPSALWLDPDQPLAEHYSEEPCMYDAEVREEFVDEQTKQIRVRYKTERRQILAQDGRGGAPIAARRTVYHPKVAPVGLQLALMMQMERDARAVLAAEERKGK